MTPAMKHKWAARPPAHLAFFLQFPLPRTLLSLYTDLNISHSLSCFSNQSPADSQSQNHHHAFLNHRHGGCRRCCLSTGLTIHLVSSHQLYNPFSDAKNELSDKYTTALLKDNTPANQFTLVALLVKTAVLGNFTGPGSANPTLPGSMVNFKGLLAPGTYNGEQVNLLGYFDGSLASTNRGGSSGVSVNFLDGQSSTFSLRNRTGERGADNNV